MRRVAANLATSAVRRRLIEARALARFWARGEPSLVELPASQTDFWRAVRSLPRACFSDCRGNGRVWPVAR
jgi:hypothetical protein